VKAVVWHGKEDVRVDNVPDPIIQESTDAIVRITSTAICGSDLHLYAKLSPLGYEIFQKKQDGAIECVLRP
jgi:threonine dehydrogenase-like Zn-dependent dehydrogenase